MGIRVQVPRRAWLVRFVMHPAGKAFFGLIAAAAVLLAGAVLYIWFHYSRLVDQKLAAGPFTSTAMLFAAPQPIAVGDPLTQEELVGLLRRRGYNESRTNRLGWYKTRADGVEIYPGQDSYFDDEAGVIVLHDNAVARIISTRDNTERSRYLLEPELISNLFDRNRQKRRMLRYDEIPKHLINAVVSIEDKRFFQHAGFDPIRIIKAVYRDVREGRKAEGASTLSMQLARNLWLSLDKTWRRKALEVLITLQIEQKLTKEQIFEHYSNMVDLGYHRSFAVHGFGEGSQVFFAKDVREIGLPEAATLAALIQKPNFDNPYRHPDRALARRNIVLGLMRDNGYINDLEYQEAAKAPLKLAAGGVESTDAPYFIDLVHDTLQDQFQDIDFQSSSYRIYTTLDMQLQRDAVEAVRAGIAEVDEQLKRRRKKYPQPQVALVALDPHTAELKALVGGRSYGASQLNRTLAKRQPGSIFKPFVYAAALSTALQGGGEVLTTVSTVVDEPTTFWFDGRSYEPNNFGGDFFGTVTMRQALTKSLNVPTVKFAEKAGFENVVAIARAAGLNAQIKPTPAVALGSYEVTPLEIADAYTLWANAGEWVKLNYIKQIRSQAGGSIFDARAERKAALDPRVAYIVRSLMEEVLRSGTGAGARSRGFLLPAAGKTGTSHDAWFAGFTTKVLCVVWVGFDDNQELPLEGAKAALPIWVEFMKRAHTHREYRGAQPFSVVDGIVTVDIDPATGQLATGSCPGARAEVFIAGTEPAQLCRLHGGGRTQIAGWETAEPEVREGERPSARSPEASPRPSRRSRKPLAQTTPEPARPKEEPKRGLWDRIRGIFR